MQRVRVIYRHADLQPVRLAGADADHQRDQQRMADAFADLDKTFSVLFPQNPEKRLVYSQYKHIKN